MEVTLVIFRVIFGGTTSEGMYLNEMFVLSFGIARIDAVSNSF